MIMNRILTLRLWISGAVYEKGGDWSATAVADGKLGKFLSLMILRRICV